MKRWILKADVTDASNLILEDAARPEPGPGEVRLRVRAISINYRDQLILQGPFGRIPERDFVPLSDVAGEIDALGDGVEDWAVGDHVTDLHFAHWKDGTSPAVPELGLGALDQDGVLAEYVVLPAARITRAPRGYSFAEASTLPVAGVTAWNAVNGDHPVAAGDKVLIIGSGGVSLFSLQLAQAAGAEVYAVVRQDAKGERLQELGVTSFVNSVTTPDWGEAVFKASGGVQKVVDTIGIATLNQSLAATASGGEVAVVGLFEMQGEPLNGFALFGKVVRGVAVGSHQMHRNLVEAVETYDIRPVISQRVAFENVSEAYAAQVSRGIFGKIVIELS